MEHTTRCELAVRAVGVSRMHAYAQCRSGELRARGRRIAGAERPVLPIRISRSQACSKLVLSCGVRAATEVSRDSCCKGACSKVTDRVTFLNNV
jgi:hypothetical protein